MFDWGMSCHRHFSTSSFCMCCNYDLIFFFSFFLCPNKEWIRKKNTRSPTAENCAFESCFWIQVLFQKLLNANPVYQINLLGFWIWWRQMREKKNTHEWRMCMVFFVNKLANIWLAMSTRWDFGRKQKPTEMKNRFYLYIIIFFYIFILKYSQSKEEKGKI